MTSRFHNRINRALEIDTLMQTTLSKLISLMVFGTLLIPAAALAQTSAAATMTAGSSGTSIGVSATITAKMTTAISRADQEIARRTTALNALNTRVQAMQKVTDQFKQSLETAIEGQVSALATLQTKIDADTDATTLKTDVQSITQSYRIYAVILPQGRIAAAADRLVTISGMMTTLGSKLQTRIAALQTGGTDVTTLSNALSDLSAKISDASTQAQQSVTISAVLTPDQGNKTTMASNTATLKEARGDLMVAQNDLIAARKDIATIMAGLKVDAGATASTSASASTQ
jgi:DNA repair ATPase RecN